MKCGYAECAFRLCFRKGNRFSQKNRFKSLTVTQEKAGSCEPASLVPVMGLEPIRYRYQRILSPSRLPFHHTGVILTTGCIIAQFLKKSKTFLKEKSTFAKKFRPRDSGGIANSISAIRKAFDKARGACKRQCKAEQQKTYQNGTDNASRSYTERQQNNRKQRCDQNSRKQCV